MSNSFKKIILFWFLCVFNSVWAEQNNNPIIEKGIYIAKGCHVLFEIEKISNRYSYELLRSGTSDSGKEVEIATESNNTIHFVELSKGFEHARIDNNKQFSLNEIPANVFSKCAKKLQYHKLDNIEVLIEELKKDNNIPFYDNIFIYNLFQNIPITKKNVQQYNDLGFYLTKYNKSKAAVAILEKVVNSFPARMVAYLNLADAYQLDNTKSNYSKIHYLSYIAQMLYAKKAKKIPQKLKQQYASYFALLNKVQHLVKNKYRFIELIEGDINQDTQLDIAFVVEYVDQNKMVFSNWGDKPSNENKRILFVYLKKETTYRLLEKSGRAIPSFEASNCDDPLESLEIKKKSLFINYQFWCSMGSWGQGRETYQFIFRDEGLVLAGLESWSDSRASGDGETISINYLTGKVVRQKIENHGDPIGKKHIDKLPTIKITQLRDFNFEEK